ncbi:MAG TPA: hypothetical protein VFN22_02080 [Gemmatimonadales bacterium]|nr:hypothetical protein [Gemmatimonadales bacterium]
MTHHLRCLTRPGVPVVWMLLACSAPTPPREFSTELVSKAGGFSISADPVLDVASTVGSQTLVSDVTDATRLVDGRIAVTDRFGERVVLIDSTGKLDRYLGRAGSGPGEFRSVEWIGLCGPGALHVWDFMASRLSTIDTAGRPIAQRSFGTRPFVFACNRTGRLALLYAPPLSSDGDAHPTLSAGSLILGPSGDTTGSLGTVKVGSTKLLGATAVLAMSDEWIVYGDGESERLEIRDFTGKRLREIETGVPRRKPTEANLDAGIEARMEMVARSDKDSIVRRLLRERIPVADRLPAYQSAMVDEHQNIWLVTSARGDGVTELRVLPTTDREPATLRLAGDVKVFEVRNGFLLGRRTDSTGVPHLVVYRVGG